VALDRFIDYTAESGMTWIALALLVALVLGASGPLGTYMYRVFEGQRTWLSPLLIPVEHVVYRCCRVDPKQEMTWKGYAFAILASALASTATLYALLRIQAWLPLNPQHFPNLSPDVAFNTAVSFMTTTDWQTYAGENAMSQLSQMCGLAWQNFVAGAAGLAAAIALFRGFSRAEISSLGNFWVDVTRALLHVLLPISIVGAVVLIACGVPDNFNAYTSARGLEGYTQLIPQGPIASQVIIKMLGGNGGGYTAAGAANPLENPSALSDFIQLLAMLIVPAGLIITFGRYVRQPRHGWTLLLAMTILIVLCFTGVWNSERAGNPNIAHLGLPAQSMEGKETRFGWAGSALSASVADGTTTGASNATFDSLTPMAGLVATIEMQLGEINYGGVGGGVTAIVMFAVLTVFICGLMVGRTPEYLGKRIERREITFVMLATISHPLVILIPAAIGAVLPAGLAALGNIGPHGFTEILYAFSSTAASNGSAFAGLSPTLFYNLSTAVVMFGGRFLSIIPALALAGAFVTRKANDHSSGQMSTSGVVFGGLVVAVILIVGALTFVPADALGPLADHLAMQRGTLY
jgi:K+-transporting ATPase ATPase A chain